MMDHPSLLWAQFDVLAGWSRFVSFSLIASAMMATMRKGSFSLLPQKCLPHPTELAACSAAVYAGGSFSKAPYHLPHLQHSGLRVRNWDVFLFIRSGIHDTGETLPGSCSNMTFIFKPQHLLTKLLRTAFVEAMKHTSFENPIIQRSCWCGSLGRNGDS